MEYDDSPITMEESPGTSPHHEEKRSHFVDVVVLFSAHEFVSRNAVRMPPRSHSHSRRGDILGASIKIHYVKYICMHVCMYLYICILWEWYCNE
jgi:hypothetical protein